MNYFLASCVDMIMKVEGLNGASFGIICMAGIVTFIEAFFFAISINMYKAAVVMSNKAIEDEEDRRRLEEVMSGAH